jgi:predicted nucleic acid-binding protein
MAFVLDASVVACWALEDEGDPTADLALTMAESDGAVSPALFWFEIRNILVVNERRGRIRPDETLRFLDYIGGLRHRIDNSPDGLRALQMARARRLTFYDAAYLELAQRLGLPLATLDRELADAARGEGVPLLGE